MRSECLHTVHIYNAHFLYFYEYECVCVGVCAFQNRVRCLARPSVNLQAFAGGKWQLADCIKQIAVLTKECGNNE